MAWENAMIAQPAGDRVIVENAHGICCCFYAAKQIYAIKHL